MISDAQLRAIAAQITSLAKQKYDEWAAWERWKGPSNVLRDFSTETMLANVLGDYEWFLERDPGAFDAMIAHLDEARRALTDPAADGVEGVAMDLRDWEGLAAEQFQDGFLAPFDATRLNQIALIDELKRAHLALRAVVTEGRKNAHDVAVKTVEKLHLAYKGDDHGAGIGLSIVAAVTAVLALVLAPPTGGASAAIYVLTLTGGAAGVTNAYVTDQVQVKGGAVPDIIASMHEALAGVRTAMREVEEALAAALREDMGIVDGHMRAYLPIRPDIADNQDATGFELPPGLE